MQTEFDSVQTKAFVAVARSRNLLSDQQAESLLNESSQRAVMASQLAIEMGVLKPVDVEIVEAFTVPKDLAPGYELLDVLGHGALGVVYRARQPHLHRDVAIKAIMQNRLTQQNVAARFQQEGAAIGRLHHPNIVSAIDFGSHRNRLYLVMELVQGADLRQRITEGAVNIQTALSIVRQTASGLAHALAHQIIHRDIKPGNLILTDAPAGFDLEPGIPLVKIGDFGLARFSEAGEAQQGDTQLTMTGATLGTPMYSAPEQLTGDVVDHRVDIYALGATLFHALAGHAPYESDTISKIIAAKITGQQPRMELLPPDLDSGVLQLLLDMMEHDSDKRLPDYESLIQRVDQIQQGSNADSGRVDPTQQLHSENNQSNIGWSTKRAVIAVATIAIVVILFALTLPKFFTEPPSPNMVPSGWESHLFDGKTVTAWTDLSGLWHSGTDAEGGAILLGKGSAVRRLPVPPVGPGDVAGGIGVRVGIDLQDAASAEVHFGLDSEDTELANRLVARVATQGVSLGRREGVEGEWVQLGQSIESPVLSDDAPNYHEIRIEMQGDHWFVYFNGELYAATDADPTANNGVIQLVAKEGTVHFEGPSVFGLKSIRESGNGDSIDRHDRAM